MLRALSAFHCEIGGTPRFVAAGQVVKPTDPAVSGRESLFAPADEVDESPRRRLAKGK